MNSSTFITLIIQNRFINSIVSFLFAMLRSVIIKDILRSSKLHYIATPRPQHILNFSAWCWMVQPWTKYKWFSYGGGGGEYSDWVWTGVCRSSLVIPRGHLGRISRKKRPISHNFGCFSGVGMANTRKIWKFKEILKKRTHF